MYSWVNQRLDRQWPTMQAFWRGHWTIKLSIQMAGHSKKLPKFGFHTHTTALWPMESSILSAN